MTPNEYYPLQIIPFICLVLGAIGVIGLIGLVAHWINSSAPSESRKDHPRKK